MCKSCRIVAQVHTWQGGLLPSSPHHLYLIFLPTLSLPTLPTACCPSPRHPSTDQCVMLPCLCPHVLIVQHLPMNETIQCLVFCSCVSLLKMMFSRFIYVPAKDMNSFFFLWLHSIPWCMCHIFFIQSIVDGHLGWFQVFAIVNSATMNIHVHLSL